MRRLLYIIAVSLILLPASALFLAWFSFPWYAPALLESSMQGAPFSLSISSISRPDWHGFRFYGAEAAFFSPADNCNETATTYKLRISNGQIKFNTPTPRKLVSLLLGPGSLNLDAALIANGLWVGTIPNQFTVENETIAITCKAHLEHHRNGSYTLKPITVTAPVSNAIATRQNLRLEGISYPVRLVAAEKWQQPLDTLRIARFYSDGKPLPMTNFTALFGSRRDPLHPCRLSLSSCSVELYSWKALTPIIHYDQRSKRSSFTLELPTIPLSALPGLNRPSMQASGEASGFLPIEFQDSTITIRNGAITASSTSQLTFVEQKSGQRYLVDLGSNSGHGALLNNLTASVTMLSAGRKEPELVLSDLSATLLGGQIRSTPLRFDPNNKQVETTLVIDGIRAFERLRLEGALNGTFTGGISARLPLRWNGKGIALHEGTMEWHGGGSVTRKASGATGNGVTSTDITYRFTNPKLQLDMRETGQATIGFFVAELAQKSETGELLFSNAKGILHLFNDPETPELVTLNAFSTNHLDGKLSIDNLRFNTATADGNGIVAIENMPLQRILDLQGAKKIYATGTIRGTLPLTITKNSIAISNGVIAAEKPGQIIYTTSDAERAAANPALRMTYDALSNLLYSALISNVNMSPDGNSTIGIRISGKNPDFQSGRAVEFNLNIDQNLRDLFRTLTISSSVEQAISDKALKKKP